MGNGKHSAKAGKGKEMTAKDMRQEYPTTSDKRNGQGWMLARAADADLDNLMIIRKEFDVPLTLLIAKALHIGTEQMLATLGDPEADTGDILGD